MKLLLAVHHFPPRYSAGAELYTFRLARWLIAHGHQAEVVCIETLDEGRAAGVTAEPDQYEGVPVWRLHLGLRNAPANWSYANPMVADWLAERMRAARPDLLHLQSGYLIGAGVIEAAHAQAIPSVVTLHDYWFLCPRITLLRGDGRVCTDIPSDPAGCAWCLQLDQRRHRLPEQISGGAMGRAWMALAGETGREQQAMRRAYLQRVLGMADLAIAPSQFLAGRFKALLQPERLQTIRLGIDSSDLQETPQPSANPETLRLAYLGQIAPHKGVHLIIQAMKLLSAHGKPVELAIYGNPEQNPAYTRQLRSLIGTDPCITLAGRFAHSQLRSILAHCDCTIVPSIWYENSPLTIMEAHAAGRPVITSRLGGMAELVRDGVDGLHFAPGDAADLARQIQRLRDEPTLLGQLQAGVQVPASIERELIELLAAYQAVITRRELSPLPEAA
ncbi:MAG: glycosyltransferase family 4 protein [Oscillochloridaceae bacterium umkhey_bin13]